MLKIDYNPDVLTCLANLSSDEVFTPPQLANRMLDALPADLWSDPNARFLDPVCKSGVFLREIAKRLNEGLKTQMPDQQTRLNHIFKNQLFGLSITQLTGLIARRSVYCSKSANGAYSVCDDFDDEQGNIRFERIEHAWQNGRCRFCGASQGEYERDESLETHAYQFIHTDNPEEIYDMKFDVIIGNPPYQLSDGGAQASAMPIYHRFIQQAKKLEPRYITMIVPSRWFSGGKGLDDFRDEMLTDQRLRKIVDFLNSADCFPGVNIKGGICYFLWERDNEGECEITTVRGDNTSTLTRPLLEGEFDTLIRFNDGVPIVHKVLNFSESSFSDIVSSRRPFGFSTDFKQFSNKSVKDGVKIYANRAVGFVARSEIKQHTEWIGLNKVFISMAYGAGEEYPHQIINKPFLGEENSCCTETYLVVGPAKSKKEADNIISYIQTRFFRFLVLLNKPTQHATSRVYSFVPMQNFNEAWTDEKLYAKYGLTPEEIAFIESMIRPMEAKVE